MAKHYFQKYLMTIGKSAIAMIAALLPGCAQHVNYPVNSDVSEENSEQSPNPLRESTVLHDATAPSFIPRQITEQAPLRQAFIETYGIKAKVVGLFVQIETELTIRNPDKTQIAGILKMPLPDGAVITGFAIDVTSEDIKHQMVDAVVLPNDGVYKLISDLGLMRKKAKKHKKKNKASSESDISQSNLFKTDIDVIVPHGYRQVRITYMMPLQIAQDGTSSVLLPMRKDKLRSRNIRVSVDIPDVGKPALSEMFGSDFVKEGSAYIFEHTDGRVTPSEDIRLSIPAIPGFGSDTFHVTQSVERDSKNPDDLFFMLGIQVGKSSALPRDLSKIRLVWDASGSRMPEDIKKSIDVVRCLPENTHFELHVFRDVLESPRVFNARDELVQYLETMAYDGGIDYAPLQAIAKSDFDGVTLFFSNGLDTFGHTIPEFGIRSSAILSGNSYDKNALWKASHGHLVDLNTVNADDAFAEIHSPKLAVYDITGAHISELQGMRKHAAERILAVGKWDGQSDKITVTLSDGTQHTVELSENEKILTGRTLATSWAIDRVKVLSADTEENRAELVRIGKQYSVISPVTDMVVLMSAGLWKANDVEPPEYLTKLHDAYMQRHEKQKSDVADTPSDTGDSQAERKIEIPESWTAYLDWWKDPIPKKIEKSYFCPEKDLTKCTMTVSSEYGEHYTVPFKPPKDWTCDDKIKCYRDVETQVGLGRVVYGPPANTEYENTDIDYMIVMEGDSNRIDIVHDKQLESIETMDWDPETPYLKALSLKSKDGAKAEELYAEYLNWKLKYSNSSAFYFDVANYFFDKNMHGYAIRILTNLLKFTSDAYVIGQAYVQRLINAGELDEAVRIAEVYSSGAVYPYDESDWLYQLARIFDLRARQNKSADDAQHAIEYYQKVISAQSYSYYGDIRLWSLVNLNALKVWIKQQKFNLNIPEIPGVPKEFEQPFDADLRIVAEFDNDSGGNELIVTEPTSEEMYSKYMGENIVRSVRGGIFVDNAYAIKKADKGAYAVSVSWSKDDSIQLIGPGIAKVTIYRNWGRPNQTQEVIIKRFDALENAKTTEEGQDDDNVTEQITVVKIK